MLNSNPGSVPGSGPGAGSYLGEHPWPTWALKPKHFSCSVSARVLFLVGRLHTERIASRGNTGLVLKELIEIESAPKMVHSRVDSFLANITCPHRGESEEDSGSSGNFFHPRG